MGQIKILDDNMVNMIAAGEVIERPASILKELLENSLDAGATRITVNIEDGGRKLICVTDNGSGMAPEDLALAFVPHATSKIKTPRDLTAITTLGFRGEALASIGAVAKVAITTRQGGSVEACTIQADCGQLLPVRPASSDYGTTVEVRDIFYKIPARRKFMRSANTEMTHIIDHFSRIALANNSIAMAILHNKKQIYNLPAGQDIPVRILQLFGSAIAEGLFRAGRQEKDLSILAFLASPNNARANAKYQYVFLNNRYIRDRFILHAVKEAYHGLIDPARHPVAFLFINMAPEEFDVNVHPTKIEVRFQNPNLVHSQVLSVLREKLLSTNFDIGGVIPAPAVDFEPQPDSSLPDNIRRQQIAHAMAKFLQDHRPDVSCQRHFNFRSSPSGGNSGQALTPATGRSSPDQTTSTAEGIAAGPDDIVTGHRDSDTSTAPRQFLQLHNSYIVKQTNDGFVVIDQHALHERLIYEQLCRKISDGKLQSQRLLIPVTLEISSAASDAITHNQQLLEKLGIEVEPFGPQTIAVQSFPAMLENVEVTAFITELLDRLCDDTLAHDPERLLHEILDMASCKAAIKAGQALSDSEIEKLLADGDLAERASRCPHGRPTTIKFTLKDLHKQFKRT